MADESGTLIFIVDDDDAVRDSLRLLLEAHGMTVKAFDSTTGFTESYRPHPRSCLILDLHLPEVSGLDYLAKLGKAGPSLPVIMVTGRGDETSRERALQLGASAFLDKPVDNGTLLSAIGRALSA